MTLQWADDALEQGQEPDLFPDNTVAKRIRKQTEEG